MKMFWTLLKESVIVQALIALTLVGVIAYLLVVGREVPTEVVSLFSVILGYYFGSKVQTKINKK